MLLAVEVHEILPRENLEAVPFAQRRRVDHPIGFIADEDGAVIRCGVDGNVALAGGKLAGAARKRIRCTTTAAATGVTAAATGGAGGEEDLVTSATHQVALVDASSADSDLVIAGGDEDLLTLF